MIIQLDDEVWFGNWSAPLELKDLAKTIINVSHHFSQRRGRSKYWEHLGQVPWDVLYVRLAKKDHDDVDAPYLDAFEAIVNQAVLLKKLPILCHCQMGNHRGPTAGVAAAWILNGKTKKALEHFTEKAEQLRPRYVKRRGVPYRKTMMDLMSERSEEK